MGLLSLATPRFSPYAEAIISEHIVNQARNLLHPFHDKEGERGFELATERMCINNEDRVISRCNPMLPIGRTSMRTFLFEDNTILTIPPELVDLALPNVK